MAHAQTSARNQIPGYDYGNADSAHSLVSLQELHELETSVGWTDQDARILKEHARVFETRAEDMVDWWRQVIASQQHLAKWFSGPNGKPDDEYTAKVKKRLLNGYEMPPLARTTRHGLITRRKSGSGTHRRKRT